MKRNCLKCGLCLYYNYVCTIRGDYLRESDHSMEAIISNISHRKKISVLKFLNFGLLSLSMSMAFLLKGKRMMVKIFGVKFSCTSRLFCSNISQSFSKKNKLSIFRTNIVQKISLNDSIFIKFTHVLDPTAKSPHSRCRHGRYVSRK